MESRRYGHPPPASIDYKKVSAAYAARFQEQGGDIFTGTEVRRINRSAEGLELETDPGRPESQDMINCGGLHADKVAEMMGERIDVRIIPFRGEYYTLRPESHHLVNGLIYPVPDPRFPFLGVHYTRNIHGQVEAGPNAVMAFKREGYRKADVNVADSWGTLSFPGFWKMSMRFWKIGVGEMHRSYSKGSLSGTYRNSCPKYGAKTGAGRVRCPGTSRYPMRGAAGRFPHSARAGSGPRAERSFPRRHILTGDRRIHW